MHGGEPEACAGGWALGREERREDLGLHVRRHPVPGVGHRQPGERAGRRSRMRAHEGVVELHGRGLERERSPVGIASRALTTRFMTTCSIWPASALMRPRSRACRTTKLDVLADDAAQHPLDAADDLVEIEHRRLHDVLSAEDEQLPGQRLRAAGGALDFLRRPRRMGLSGASSALISSE